MYVYTEVFILLVAFTIKHFIADFPLQSEYMLKKSGRGTTWVLPLLAHSSVHAFLTLVILTAFRLYSEVSHIVELPWSQVITLVLIDLTIHAVTDIIKASPYLLGRYQLVGNREVKAAIKGFRFKSDRTKFLNRLRAINRDQKYFWWALGADQMVHHLTNIGIIYLIFNWQ